MSLPKNYTQAPGRIPELFERIRDGQAPDQLTQQVLKDWGFTSSNDRALLPILKTLGFLSPDGRPTSLYHEYRDYSQSRTVLGRALKKAYSDLFLIREHPTESDKDAIQGKFKSYHNVSDRVASLMTKTFYALLDLADLKAAGEIRQKRSDPENVKKETKDTHATPVVPEPKKVLNTGLHYNIQIHLPATKDIEVYNAIFKSLKEHLVDE